MFTFIRLRCPASAAFAVLLVLAACKAPAPAQSHTSPGEPELAVRRLADDLAKGDLAAFASHAVPAQEHAALDQAWRDGRSRWPLDELPLDAQIVPLVQTLAAPDAERQLRADYDSQFAGQTVEIRQAVHTLAQFSSQYVGDEPSLEMADRAHYAQLIPVLAHWAATAPLADATRAHQALHTLVASAQRTGIVDEADVRAPGLDAGLAKLTPFLGVILDTVTSYGLNLRASLSSLRTQAAVVHGQSAIVPATYTLGGNLIHIQVAMQRQEQRWYLAHPLALAQRLRQTEPPSSPIPPSTAPQAPAASPDIAEKTVAFIPGPLSR